MNRAQLLLKDLMEADPADNNPQPASPHTSNTIPNVDKGDDKEGPETVDGGVLFRQDITPKELKDQTQSLQQMTIVKNKRWNSQFEIFRDPIKNEFQLFHLMFDQKTFASGNTNPERSERIKYVGAFKSREYVMKFLRGEAQKFRLPQDSKSINISGQPGKKWQRKELGF